MLDRQVHNCRDEAQIADPARPHFTCSCGARYRAGLFEFWAFLFNRHIYARGTVRGCYWYRIRGRARRNA